MQRQQQIRAWLDRLRPGLPYSFAPASADASFRRYFRVSWDNGETRIVMDAPPDREDVGPWLRVQALFRAAGVHVPEVVAEDREQGFLLIADLGATTYLADLRPDNADQRYRQAGTALIAIQRASRPGILPEYDRESLQRELDLFPDWYLARHAGLEVDARLRGELQAVFERILAVNLAEPRVYVHRDYHSRNLMVSDPCPGIIDFQDAVHGPLSYDLVSLFKDAYIEWEEERILDWLIRYWEAARKAGLPVRRDFAEFHLDYEWMGVQRHLKVLGIFARLWHRDGKDGYLQNMPLVAKYLRAACARYRELTPILRLLDRVENRQARAGYTF